MSEFFKAELKDKFLQYASERDDYFETGLLYDEFLRPNYSLDYVEKRIKEIIDHDPDLLDIMSGNGMKIFMLSSTAYTVDFLEEGGFTSLYIQEEEKWDTFLQQLANTRKLSREEKSTLGKTKKKAYQRERILLFSLIGAVATSFLFTIFSLLSPLFSDKKYLGVQEFETRMKALESENGYLKEQLQTIQNELVEKDSIN
ncbi:MAG: hypothetical protein AAF717_11835 [Bacteroidota bacterium]